MDQVLGSCERRLVLVESDAERRPAPPVRDDRADRLRAARLAELLVQVALADREAARRARGFAVQPGAAGDHGRLDQWSFFFSMS
jgi:hypothetical protein